MRHYIAQNDGTELSAVHFNVSESDAELKTMGRGDRVLFYQLRGEGEEQRGVFVGWGEVDRLGSDDAGGVAHLKKATAFKRRIPFTELRSDPRRDRAAIVQAVPAEVFNQVLARSRR